MRVIRTLLIVTAMTVTAQAALDLNPALQEYTAEGITFRQLCFKDGERTVKYEVPNGWAYVALGAQLRLTPAKFERAFALLSAAPGATAQQFDAKAVEAAQKAFAASLPPTAQDVKILAEELNPLVLNGGVNTYEITATYKVSGDALITSVLFANAAEAQLNFRLTARKADFAKLHNVFRSSLLSWQWVEPKGGKRITASVPAAAGSTH